MYAVVIDGVAGDRAAWIRAAADALGTTPYEVTASVSVEGGGPAVISTHADDDAARAVAERLRNARFRTCVVDVAELEAGVRGFEVREFVFEGGSFVASARDGSRLAVDPAEISLLVRASRLQTTEKTKLVKERKLSVGRAVLSGGLLLTKTETVKHTSRKTDSQELLYVFVGAGASVVLGESDIVYQGLGAAMQPSRAANFAYVVDTLRRLAPRARVDERLRRRALQTQILGRTISPDDHFELAVALVAASHLNGWG